MKEMNKEKTMEIISKYAEKHPLAVECDSEYIYQNDNSEKRYLFRGKLINKINNEEWAYGMLLNVLSDMYLELTTMGVLMTMISFR